MASPHDPCDPAHLVHGNFGVRLLMAKRSHLNFFSGFAGQFATQHFAGSCSDNNLVAAAYRFRWGCNDDAARSKDRDHSLVSHFQCEQAVATRIHDNHGISLLAGRVSVVIKKFVAGYLSEPSDGQPALSRRASRFTGVRNKFRQIGADDGQHFPNRPFLQIFNVRMNRNLRPINDNTQNRLSCAVATN